MKGCLIRLSYFFLLGVLSFELAIGCAQSVKNPSGFQQSNEACRVVQHAMGETCVPNYPQRLVALNPATLADAIALGIKPIGTTYDYDNRLPEYLEKDIEGIELVGTWAQPSIEKIALLKPDLIIGWQHNYESIYPQLSEIAPTVLYDWKSTLSQRDYWKKYLNFVAEVIGREEASQKVWQTYNQQIEKLRQAIGDRYQGKTISVVLFCCGQIYAKPENSFIGSILKDVGLERPSSQGYSEQGFISFS